MTAAGPKTGVTVRRSLTNAAFAIVLVVLGVFLSSVYVVIYRPAVRELAIAQLRSTSQQVEGRMLTMIRRVESVSAISRDWGARGLIDLDKVHQYNHLLQPILKSGPGLSSVVAADETGHEVLLMQTTSGGWMNRLTDPERRPGKATFINWDANLKFETEELKDLDYDARKRPWFMGAMALPDDRNAYWTAPFIFRSSQEPGLSAVVRWVGLNGRRHAMTHDLKLIDLSRFTRDLVAGTSGFVAVVSEDGKLIGVPHDPRFADDAAVKAAVLRPATEAGVPPLTQGLALWNQSGRGNDKLLRFDVEGTPWLALFKRTQFGSQTFWTGTLAPQSDFLPSAARNLLPVAALALFTLALAGLIATRLARRFTRPLEQLAAESGRIGRLELDEPVAVQTPWRELNQLSEAQEQMRLALLAATRRLADANESLEAKVAERTRALEASEAQARAATRAKTDFLANMSHEIRTPMNAIIGMAHLAMKGDLPSKQRDQLTKIQQASHHLLGIINDILDSSKIEAGKVTLEHSAFRLADVVRNVVTLIEQKAAAKGLRLRVDVADDIPDVLVGDALRLGQILVNYASNAVKFTEHGEVTIEAALRESNDADVLLECSVADTGIGLAPEELQRLFQPFAQADTSTTRRYGGSGLGLVIARNLAELMGGAAGADSARGKGSRFWFTARLEKARAAVSPSTVAPPALPALAWDEPRLRTPDPSLKMIGRLLLAEDNPVNQEIAIGMLADWGLEVDIAADGQAAVQKAAARPYDAILMDMQMPVMDGLTAARAIRLLPGGGQVPIIALTANARADDREHCLAAGMNDHLGKPLEPAALQRTLLRWLQPGIGNGSGGARPGGRRDEAAGATPTGGAALGSNVPMAPPTIVGLNSTEALRRIGGKTTLYLSLLRKFADGNAQTARDIQLALANGERDAAIRLAHALRGVAGNLGAVDVQLHAAAVEEALVGHASPPRLDDLLAALSSRLDPLVADLRAKLPVDDGTAREGRF